MSRTGRIAFAKLSLVLPVIVMAGASTPAYAQKVSDLDAAVRPVVVAALAGKPMSSVRASFMSEGDLDELFRVMRAGGPPVLRFCRRLIDPAREARNRTSIKRSMLRTTRRWERMRETIAKSGKKFRFVRIREFRSESDCDVRFYRLKLEVAFSDGDKKRRLRVRGMNLIYFGGRFKIISMFRLRIPKPKRAPKSPREDKPKRRDVTRGLIG